MLWNIINTIPHLTYVFSYHYGDTLMSVMSFNTFKNSCIIYRSLLFPYTIMHFYNSYFHTWNISLWISPEPYFFLGLLLFISGMFINYKVYDAIGFERVYYGCELNKNSYIRINKFPYNCLDHPMYYACILMSIGTFFSIGITDNYTIRYGVLDDTIFIIYLYLFSIKIEDMPSLTLKNKLLKLNNE